LDLRSVTISHISSLTKFLSYRRLFIAGLSGCGKHLFAIEAAYRALRAGSKTLIVYRNVEFKEIYKSILHTVANHLTLMHYEEFRTLIARVVTEEVNCSQVAELVGLNLPKNADYCDLPLWDLLIVDDWSTDKPSKSMTLALIEQISTKKILLSQEINSIEDADVSTELEAPAYSGKRIINELDKTKCEFRQPIYKSVLLTKNVRCAREIVDELNFFTLSPVERSVSEGGQVLKLNSNWSNLSSVLKSTIEGGLKVYSPFQIKVVVDPELKHPDISKHDRQSRTEQLLALSERVNDIVSLVLIAAAYELNSSNDKDGIDYLQCCANKLSAKHVNLFSTNGYRTKLVRTNIISDHKNEPKKFHYKSYDKPDIDVINLLDQDVFNYPCEPNTVLIEPTTLARSFEAEMVIYIRNRNDTAENAEGKSAISKIHSENLRRKDHFNAMSIAKHRLVTIYLA